MGRAVVSRHLTAVLCFKRVSKQTNHKKTDSAQANFQTFLSSLGFFTQTSSNIFKSQLKVESTSMPRLTPCTRTRTKEPPRVRLKCSVGQYMSIPPGNVERACSKNKCSISHAAIHVIHLIMLRIFSGSECALSPNGSPCSVGG